MFKTFNGWKLVGRHVIAGERMAYRNEYGDGMFHRDQTASKDGVERIVIYRDRFGRFTKAYPA